MIADAAPPTGGNMRPGFHALFPRWNDRLPPEGHCLWLWSKYDDSERFMRILLSGSGSPLRIGIREQRARRKKFAGPRFPAR